MTEGTLPSPDLLYEQAACGLLATTASGIILRVNATLCRWLNYNCDDLLGRKVEDLFAMGGKVFHQTHCMPLLQIQGSVAEVQLDLLQQDGTRLPMLINIVRRHHGNMTVDEFAMFMATDRRSYERELLVARRSAEAALDARLDAEAQLHRINQQLSLDDRRKNEFLATLAHELRNPLAPMRNVIESLKHQFPGASPHARTLGVLERQLSHLTHLVEDLMETSRITQGLLELRCQRIDLTGVVQSALDDSQCLFRDAGHTIEVDLPDVAVLISADAMRLVQVVSNLLTNAAKYTPRGGHIRLCLRQQDADAIISVHDNGIGIPAEALSSIFDIFSQLAPALERSQGGLGIGLALVRGLVALHGGSIEATSAGVGMGSEFVVRLPLAAPLTSAPAVTTQAALESGVRPCRILVIDDNTDSAESMLMVLELFGHQGRTAPDGNTGLQVAADFMPQMVLLDIGLPDINGYEVARRIRAAPWGHGMFIIAATGWGQATDKQLAQDAGCDAHLTKPIDFTKLQALIQQLPG